MQASGWYSRVLEKAGSCEKRAGVLGDGNNGADNRRSNENFQLGGKAIILSLDDLSGGERIENSGFENHELARKVLPATKNNRYQTN